MNPIPPPPEEIGTLLARINPHSPVRRIAESLLSGTHDPLSGVDPLFTTLSASSGRPWRERVAAAWALGRAPLSPQEHAAATDMLMDALERDSQYSFWSTFRSGLMGGYGVCLAFGLLSAVYMKLSYPYMADTGLQLFLIFSCIAALLTSPVILPTTTALAWHRNRKRNSLRATAAESLGRLAAPESLGALAGALFDNSAPIRPAAATALHAVLPTITDEHYGLFGSASMTALGRALKHDDTYLVLKLLAALGKIGTSHALPYVEEAAANSNITRIRDVARDTFYRMQERHLQEREAQTLMRASYQTPTVPDELLRPAHGSAPDDPLQLLRAVEGE